MRIFISIPDQTGSQKTTRLSISNCTDTTQLIKQIAKQLSINKNAFIFLLKNEIVNLRILQNWPLSIYGVKNGSWIIVKENLLFNKKQLSNSSTASLGKIEQGEQEINQEMSISSIQSPIKDGSLQTSRQEQVNYHEYFQQQLVKMLTFVRQNRLDKIAILLKQQPSDIEDEQIRDEITRKKNAYILNEIGECGRNALHWAIHNQNVQIVTFLLLKHVDPTVLTIDDYSPLQLAIVFRNIQLVKILLSQPKVDPNRITNHGTALHISVQNNCIHLIKELIDYGVNVEQVDKDGKRPIDRSQSKEVKSVFEDYEKKLKLRFIKPNITKGNVLKISPLTWRGKQRVLMVNPFKGDLTIFKDNNIVDFKIKITTIKQIQKITQKSWLMDGKLHYFKIVYFLERQQEKIILAIKHLQILGKWLDSFDLAKIYVTNEKYVSKIQPQMQLIQVLDDTKNQIKVHKRQVDVKKIESPSKKKYSIMEMDISEDKDIEESKQKKVQQKTLQKYAQVHFEQRDTFGGSFASSTQGNQLRQSQILLGSVLMQKNFDTASTISTSRNTVMSAYFGKQQPSQNTQQFHSLQEKPMSNFRKKSFDVIKISQFQFQEQQKVTFSNFDFIKQLGSGAFGQVYLTKHRKTQKVFAMKVLNKKRLMAKKQLKYAVSETNILKRIEHPFIIGLYYSFQTPSNLYLALDYCPNGDLSQLLCQKQKFSQATAKFIIAQCILAIEYVHKQKIIYRDLKPQNILIGKDGYIKLTDFGLSKQNNKNFATSFCGSPAYLSPQMLDKKGHSYPTDIYGLGCILYEMVVGQPPYYDEIMQQMFENIKNARLKFPGYLSKEIKTLISRMLDRDVTRRIGSSDMNDLKAHQFFQGLSWEKLSKKQFPVPKQIFPESIQNDYFKLQNQEIIRYADQDYVDNSMLNRIKGFSFSRPQKSE